MPKELRGIWKLNFGPGSGRKTHSFDGGRCLGFMGADCQGPERSGAGRRGSEHGGIWFFRRAELHKRP